VILAYGCGRVNVEMCVDEKWTKSFLSDVLYVPDLGINLFSLIVAEMKGYRVCTENSQVRLVHIQDDVVVAVGVRHGKSPYKMNMNVVRPDCDCEAVAHLTSVVNPKTEKLQFWHERLCHQNKKYVKDFLQQEGVDVPCDDYFCEACALGKGVLRRQLHRRSGLATLPSVGAVP